MPDASGVSCPLGVWFVDLEQPDGISTEIGRLYDGYNSG